MTIPFRKESHRKERVEGLIKQEISRIILHELKDPRCGFCTVTRVHVSGDLKTAAVYVSVLGEEANQRTTLRGLQHAKGFIERRLFKELKLKHPPAISFHIDHSIERSVRISQILREEGVPEDGVEQENEYEIAENPEENGLSGEAGGQM
jgi:ribosome-binding factor A